jgi:hypothetical protein
MSNLQVGFWTRQSALGFPAGSGLMWNLEDSRLTRLATAAVPGQGGSHGES